MAHEDEMDSVTIRIAELAERYMGVDRAAVLSGTPLTGLIDSLWLMELVMLLEREYGVDINVPAKLPAGLDAQCLAREVCRARLDAGVARARHAALELARAGGTADAATAAALAASAAAAAGVAVIAA